MMTHLLTFAAGFLCGLATWLLWLAIRFVHDVRAAQESVQRKDLETASLRDLEALQAVEACKNRLRWQKRVNPEWLPPLLDELPRLVREIARIYYPQHPEPLLGPGLSQFSWAVHLTALDVADFLKNRSIGRLVDVSAGTAVRTWEMTHKIATHNTTQTVGRWYRRLLPVWQVVKYKSPVVWAGVAISNVATRTLQPVIVDIVARRAMDLYSGRVVDALPGASEPVKE
jgi:hypothetical protein